MNSDIYSVLALIARYGFAALMLFVVGRAFVMTKTDAGRAKKLRTAAQPVGELREKGRSGAIYPLPESGFLGSGRSMDVRVRSGGIRRKHAYFEQRTGCILFESVHGAPIRIGPEKHKGQGVLARNGDVIRFGDTDLTLLLYAAPTRRSAPDDFFAEDT